MPAASKILKFIILIISFHNTVALASPKEGIWDFEVSQSKTSAPDDVAFFDQNSERHFLEEYEDKTLLVVFWASWCAFCSQQMSDLDILQKDFRKLPFDILPISEDYQDVKTVEHFYKRYDIRHLPIFRDYRNQLFKSFGVISIPTSFLIDENGIIIGTFSGIVPWNDEEVREILLKHITGHPPAPKNTSKTPGLNYIASPQPQPKAVD